MRHPIVQLTVLVLAALLVMSAVFFRTGAGVVATGDGSPTPTPTRTPKATAGPPQTWASPAPPATQTPKPTPNQAKIEICITAYTVGTAGQAFWNPGRIENHIQNASDIWDQANINFTWNGTPVPVQDPVSPPPGEDGDLIQDNNEDDLLARHRDDPACYRVFFIHKWIDNFGRWSGLYGQTVRKGYFGQSPGKLGSFTVIDSKANKTGNQTLAHELGHALCLQHVGSAGLENNLMWYAKAGPPGGGNKLTAHQQLKARGCAANLLDQLGAQTTATPTPKDTPTPAPTPKVPQEVKIVNNSTGKASDLAILFNDDIDKATVLSQPAACPTPVVAVNDDTVIIIWSTKCVQKGDQVTIGVIAQKDPITVTFSFWTNAGTPIPTQVPTVPNLGANYDALITLVPSVNGAPGAYFHCKADIQQDDKELDGHIYCYVDSPAIDVNPEASPGVFGDGLPNSPPPEPYGDVPSPHDTISGHYDNGDGMVHLTSCMSREGVLGPNVYWEAVLSPSVVPLQGVANVWTTQTPVDCFAGTPAGPPTFGDAPIRAVELAKKPNEYDSDKDGCSDKEELEEPDPTSGGLRDPYNVWDFFDTNSDARVDLPNDILGVILRWTPSPSQPYDVVYDRGPTLTGSAGHWNRNAADGVIDLPNDILGVILQWQHNCDE